MYILLIWIHSITPELPPLLVQMGTIFVLLGLFISLSFLL